MNLVQDFAYLRTPVRRTKKLFKKKPVFAEFILNHMKVAG